MSKLLVLEFFVCVCECKCVCLSICTMHAAVFAIMCELQAVRTYVCAIVCVYATVCVCISGCTGGIYSLLKGFQRVRFKAISSSSLDSRDAVGVVLGPAKLLQAATTTTVSCPDRDVCLAGFASDRARQVKANIATQS